MGAQIGPIWAVTHSNPMRNISYGINSVYNNNFMQGIVNIFSVIKQKDHYLSREARTVAFQDRQCPREVRINSDDKFTSGRALRLFAIETQLPPFLHKRARQWVQPILLKLRIRNPNPNLNPRFLYAASFMNHHLGTSQIDRRCAETPELGGRELAFWCAVRRDWVHEKWWREFLEGSH